MFLLCSSPKKLTYPAGCISFAIIYKSHAHTHTHTKSYAACRRRKCLRDDLYIGPSLCLAVRPSVVLRQQAGRSPQTFHQKT